MKDETKRYGDEAYEIDNYAAKTVGSRLPGSDGEKNTLTTWVKNSAKSVSSRSRKSFSFLRAHQSAACHMQAG